MGRPDSLNTSHAMMYSKGLNQGLHMSRTRMSIRIGIYHDFQWLVRLFARNGWVALL